MLVNGKFMTEQLITHLKTLEKLERHRIIWLRISGFVTLVVMLVIAKWDAVTSSKLQWVLTSAGITITVVWWYWTMIVIRQILHSRLDEAHVLAEIANEVQDIKHAIKTEPLFHVINDDN